MTEIKHSAIFLSARGRQGPTELEQKENETGKGNYICLTFARINGNYTNNRYCFWSNFGIYCRMGLESVTAIRYPQLQYLNTGKSFNLYHHAVLLSMNGNWLLDETQKNRKRTDCFCSYKMMIRYTLDEMNKLFSFVGLNCCGRL